MKKFGLGLLVAAALMMIPVCAFALTPISNSQMEAITAQSGVSIAVDDVVLYNHFDNIAYTDSDGTHVVDTTPATVNLANISMLTYINAIGYDKVSSKKWISLGGMGLQGTTASCSYDPGANFAQALTIDVGTQPILSAGYTLVLGTSTTPQITVTGVMIGLPTLEIYVPSLTVTPTVTEDDGTVPVYNTGADYGTIALNGMTTAILGGHLEIAPH